MKFNDEFKLNPLICSMGWDNDSRGSGMGGDNGESGSQGGSNSSNGGGSWDNDNRGSGFGPGGNRGIDPNNYDGGEGGDPETTETGFLDFLGNMAKRAFKAAVAGFLTAGGPGALAGAAGSALASIGEAAIDHISEAMVEAGVPETEARTVAERAAPAVEALATRMENVPEQDREQRVLDGIDEIVAEINTSTSQDQQGDGQGDESSEEEYDMTKDPNLFWDTFVGEWFNDENNAKMVFQDHADFMAGEANARNDAAADATNKYTSTLDRLTSQYAKPVSFTMGGNNVSFVPRGARNTITSLGGVGESKMNSKINLADSTFENAEIRSPKVGQLTYMDALSKLLDKEKARNQTISDAAYKAKIAAAGQQRVDQDEPGWLDYLGAGVNTYNGLFGSGGVFPNF